MPASYFVYSWNNLGAQAITVGKMHQIADVWGIPNHKSMTRGQLRRAIMNHPSNKSAVPHPLIQMPV